MDDSPFDGLSSIVRLSGAAVPARARFVGEALISSTFSSLTLGLCAGMIGSSYLTMGPLIPFLVGSWTGYSLGLVQHWRTAKRTTLQYARNYPTILAHALYLERGIQVPPGVVQATEARLDKAGETATTTMPTLDDWIRQGGLGLLTWSILSAQSCRGDVEALQRQQRQRLVEEYQERHA